MDATDELVRQRLLEARAAMRRLTQRLAATPGEDYERAHGIREDLEVMVREWHLTRGLDTP